MAQLRTPSDGSHRGSAEGENVVTVSGEIDVAREFTELHLPKGGTVRLPTHLLVDDPGQGAWEVGESSDMQHGVVEPEQIVIPLIEERLVVGKRVVTTARVTLEKSVEEYKETLNEPLAVRTFDIERVVLNRQVDAAPRVRQEGDTTVYPVVEEQMVLTKRLILKEEVRVTKRDTERRDTQVITLHREHLTVRREPIGDQPVRNRDNRSAPPEFSPEEQPAAIGSSALPASGRARRKTDAGR